jgi:hypothetical protein
VRDQALEALKSFTGEEIWGYQSEASPETQAKSLESWANWLLLQQKQVDKRAEIAKAAHDVASGPKVQTAAQVQNIALLIQSLASPDLKVREISFAALSEYARKYVPHEVREDFGYDPKAYSDPNAPATVRSEPLTHWNKWFETKVKPVMEEEQKRSNQVREWATQLAPGKINSVADLEVAANLVKALEDIASSIRKEALTALQKFNSGESYGFNPEQSVELQKQELQLWQCWLKRQKKLVEKAK